MQVVPNLPFIHPSEISLLNRICRLGTYYLQLRQFISQQTEATLSLRPLSPLTAESANRENGGLYLKALAHGIDQVLESYRQQLVRVEKKVRTASHKDVATCMHHLECSRISLSLSLSLSLLPSPPQCIEDPHLPLSHLQSEFESYQLLLPSLDACVKHIHRHKLYGCRMLSHLHQQCSSGVPVIHEAFVK